jgi:Icc protein
MLYFAHISDIHLDLRPRAHARARRVMTYLRTLPLDAILVTGDISDHGSTAEYEQAKAELAAEVPVLMLPGNHDNRAVFRRVLLGEDGQQQPLNMVRSVGNATFVLCDSVIPGQSAGVLTQETIEWLGGVLADGDGPAFVCLHHPPVPLHSDLIDGVRLGEPGKLAAQIARHPRVVAILCGHAHAAAASTFAGRPLLVTPGICSTLRLPWATTDQLTWRNTLDYESPLTVAFHVLDDTGRLTTHYIPVPPAMPDGRPDKRASGEILVDALNER